MRLWYPQKILVEKEALDYPLTGLLLNKLKSIPREVVAGAENFIDKARISESYLRLSRQTLLLAVNKGNFVKPCPCAPFHISCDYFIINLELNCPLNCTYCILQDYLSHPLPTVHVNRDSLWAELDGFLAARKGKITRIGTGELGDSLALDHITESSKALIDYFRDKPGVFFELKTKTTNIKNLLDIEPAGNIVVSWSLNAEEIARQEEKGAPSVKERIGAARLIAQSGFPVAFHFDPIVYHPGWKAAYAEVINSLLKAVPPERIAWISLGCLRFTPSLKRSIGAAFPRSRIVHAGFIRGKDGKWRYFRPLRAELYKGVLGALGSRGGGDIPVYLCMESPAVWKAVEGKKKRERKFHSSSFPLRVVCRDQKCLWLKA